MTFADETAVRLRYGFHHEQVPTGFIGVTILLKQRAYSIISITKNGVLFVDTVDYTFTKPKLITLIVPAVDTDFFEVVYATEIASSVIVDALENADEDIKAIMVRRFGAAAIASWATSPPAYIVKLAERIAGLYSERAMLRKMHEYDPMAFATIQRGLDKIMSILEKIDLGALDLIGETPTGDTIAQVGRGGDNIFSELQDVGADYDTYYFQPDKEDKNDSREKNW